VNSIWTDEKTKEFHPEGSKARKLTDLRLLLVTEIFKRDINIQATEASGRSWSLKTLNSRCVRTAMPHLGIWCGLNSHTNGGWHCGGCRFGATRVRANECGGENGVHIEILI